ncbi:uncharacterized protein [Haliotis cracherodii]|uniref:uncharacterized protein n=1 Tax=Haliotis cracherodii TaxID=6455 RepID=UPI0039E8E980
MAERFNCRLLLSCFVFILFGAECKVCQSECKDGLCQPSGLCDDCRDGFYGIRCNKKCPPTCTDSLCYRFNVSCKKECSEGLYGKKCDKQCSRCPGSCHRRTGECAGNSSARMHLSSMDHQSPVESDASEDSVPDPMLPLVGEIWIPVAGILVMALITVLVCLIQRKRRLTNQSRVPEDKDTSKQSDNASAKPLVEA